MVKFTGIGINETRDLCGAARPTGFYSGDSAAHYEQNIQLGQKRLFRAGLWTPNLKSWIGRFSRGHAQGEPPGPDHL